MSYSSLPSDYLERVYAGVLGKIIGVYLGRPFEGWGHEAILEKLGEVDYYVHDKLGQPLVVTDDDITGTFTFLRALADHGFDPSLSPKQIGDTWLNYLIEGRTILWWGGMGMSTEHTAYLRLKHGVHAPESGSIALNGQTVAEQIGSQIFIDGWGLIHPNDPVAAADFARRAASVSHDGEAIHGAVVVAAMVAAAFGELSVDELLDVALAQIPSSSLIAELIRDVRQWHAEGLDWRAGFAKIRGRYGYDKYGGNCHIVPNHALIIHALLHGNGDFQRSLMIVNTCGWDTDCNSGNVGCILGVLLGLEGIQKSADWRGPVADKVFLPTADGGRTVSDAVTETYDVAEAAYRLRGLAPEEPKGGARFHFSLAGSVQGFEGDVEHVNGRLRVGSEGFTRTWVTPADRKMGGYGLYASPTLYPGQTISAQLRAVDSAEVKLVVEAYGADDSLVRHEGPATFLAAGEDATLRWQVPELGGYPIARVGLVTTGTVELDSLGWTGCPSATFAKTEGGRAWRDQWTNAASDLTEWAPGFRPIQNEGTGLVSIGTREWTDYRVQTTITPNLAERFGVAVRHQGMRRYVAVTVERPGVARLCEQYDGELTILAEVPIPLVLGESYAFDVEVRGKLVSARINGTELRAEFGRLANGGVAFLVTEGRVDSPSLTVSP